MPASTSAMFLIRNLAFSRTSKAFFHTNERTIPILLKALKSPSLESRAYASSAIWAITCHERRVASLLKKAGGLPMIQEAEAHTKEEMKKTQEILQGCDCGTVNERPLVSQAYIHNLLKHIEQVWTSSVSCCEIQELDGETEYKDVFLCFLTCFSSSLWLCRRCI